MRAEPFDKLRTALVEALQRFALRQAQGASKSTGHSGRSKTADARSPPVKLPPHP